MRSGWQYPVGCCGGQDCITVKPSEVAVRPDGWLIRGHTVPYGREQIAPDGQFHICVHNNTVRCFFVPDQGV